MNTHQTTKNNPIPLIKPQPPLPILIDGVKFSYFKSRDMFYVESGIIQIHVNEFKFIKSTTFENSNYIFAIVLSDYREKEGFIFAEVTDNQRKLLEIWIDRCKGVSL